MSFRDWFDGFVQRPLAWPWSGFVPIADQSGIVADDKTQGFTIDSSYMTFRLAEMHLQKAGELWRDFVPLCLTVADYYYDGETRSLPFIVSQDKLKEAFALVRKDTDPLLVQMLDTRLVGPVPILHEEVGLFTGLFRIERADRLEILLEVLGKLGEGAGVAALTSGVPIAKAAYDGLGRLLGMKGVEYQFGTRRGFKVGKGFAEPLRPGLIAFTGSVQAGIEQNLRARGNRLVRYVEGVSVPVRDIDYCLIAVEHTLQRGSFVDLPFHKLWLALVPKLLDNPESGWQKDWVGLVAAIRTSPDLVRADKSGALVSYLRLRDEELAVARGEPTGTAHRGSGASASALNILEAAAIRSEVEGTTVIRGAVGKRADRKQRGATAPNDVDHVAREIVAAFGNVLPDPDLIADELLTGLIYRK